LSVGLIRAEIGRAIYRAKITPHYGQFASAFQAGFQRLTGNLSLGQPRLAGFFLQGMSKLLTQAYGL
jgi:hypothetical protein